MAIALVIFAKAATLWLNALICGCCVTSAAACVVLYGTKRVGGAISDLAAIAG
jgi:hypothetical protein